jgi:hypothetical protein
MAFAEISNFQHCVLWLDRARVAQRTSSLRSARPELLAAGAGFQICDDSVS